MSKDIYQIAFDEISQTDLIFYHCGYESCFSGKAFGPMVRDHFLIHFIYSGKGILNSQGKTYQIEKGQGFLICPHETAFYQTDNVNLWKYAI